jgi:hypothetical protein
MLPKRQYRHQLTDVEVPGGGIEDWSVRERVSEEASKTYIADIVLQQRIACMQRQDAEQWRNPRLIQETLS